MKKQTAFLSALTILAWGATAALAQPAAPTTPDLPCSDTPGKLTANDTLPYVPDGEGYTSLFDGTSFKGWWQDCQTTHSQNDRINGAIWRVDPTLHAIYSTQRGGNNGGIMATKKMYGNYEIMFDIWPSFGDDGGLFNRVTPAGKCFQTVLDYIEGGSFGGVWGEAGFPAGDQRPFAFHGSDSTLNIPGQTTRPQYDWTKWTAGLKPTGFGCSAGGCTQDDWRKVWNLYGWNTVRVKFYGGLTKANKIHMESFTRRDDAHPWVPLWVDSLDYVDTANFLGLQVHYGGRFGGAHGNWYRNIKIRQLDDNGAPKITTAISIVPKNSADHGIRALGGSLTGSADEDYVLTLSDLSGRLLGRFSGKAGSFRQSLPAAMPALFFADVKTAKGTVRQEVRNLAR